MFNMEGFKGLHKVLLVGREDYVQINIDRIIVDGYAHPIFVIDIDETVYNWSNVIMLVKIR